MSFQRFIVTENPDTKRYRVLDLMLGQYLSGEHSIKGEANDRAANHNWLFHGCKTDVKGFKKARVRA